MSEPHYDVAVIGGSQAGLSMSYHLSEAGIDHVVFEKNSPGHAWRTQRWDNFCLVTPNWQCKLPGFPYPGDEPNGFMPRDEIVRYVEDYAARIEAPLRLGVGVQRLGATDAGFRLETSDGACTADAVVLAVGGYHQPNIPRLAERLPEGIVQIHSSGYRNSRQLPPGAVMVVGSGQSGCQIAEDLLLDGRDVHLVVGSAPRSPRAYRGRDATDWLYDLGQYDLPVERHSLGEKVRRRANHYMTGRGGGREIDLRRFATQGMTLYGRLLDLAGGRLRFGDDLRKNLDAADTSYDNICAVIDRYIDDNGIAAPPGHRCAPVWQPGATVTDLDPVAAGISAIVWATGFRSDWSWVDLPIFDGAGYPTHTRGVTSVPGIYVLGLPWLYTWGSGRFVGVGRDAAYLAERIQAHRHQAALAAA
ncbi:MAG TPA: MSMEG_0569 family flavin-dependent oxidoreductase [Rhodopila sp.]|uniref:MSMEG_0569 family flavin-dependent oxidoreductase n=1 Tax=Rhodopila sp. TaxID=2480087 RepID=UPI002C4F8862|nr:MSMEG_0569 family flavin-dependent oxidoreductase [Rhodopila sp.]HVY14599.1 MSMEG_0569 family flavin-dependent oxidoreductase [Rhodopila sp.]